MSVYTEQYVGTKVGGMSLIHFLLIFDHSRGELIEEPRQFIDADEAASAYAELEQLHRGDKHLEIVLVGSDSIETVKQTHGNYFNGRQRRHLVEELTAT